ncbi:helix-turn-helix transcriptional regulator [Vibrio marisflavi]|uniref:HTH luxR-type domain-containing protein n=1 Tax=Vibrio marisflavi CECT 7928 TaxID=634439 RepID=A0ABM8ZYS4_9VIBR|nr:hypothetical protein [Vibrio marisflavi]CAH0536108.1 hypothetical protein VMF7928_00202 [Vibrio marisflavi CECT 7928]
MTCIERFNIAADSAQLGLKEIDRLEENKGMLSSCSIAMQNILDAIIPDLNIINFSFSRIDRHSQLTCVSLRPDMIFGLYKLGILFEEPTLNLSQVRPIYDRFSELSKPLKDAFVEEFELSESVRCIVLEFDIGHGKDSFYFLFEDKYNSPVSAYFNILHNLSLYFYKTFNQEELEVLFNVKSLEKYRVNDNEQGVFSPFDSLKERFDLTTIQLNYLKLIALEMDSKNISIITNRSVRTVEAAILELRRKFSVKSKFHLECYLKLHYIRQVNQYLYERTGKVL